jgi:hypothetical protein
VRNIQFAGSVVEVMGVRGAMTIRITTPTTSRKWNALAQFTYINHGDGYLPGWRRDFNTANLMSLILLGHPYHGLQTHRLQTMPYAGPAV